MERQEYYAMDRPLYDNPVYQTVVGLLNSEWFVWFNLVLGVVLTAVFLAYCLSKEGRDEHGRAIIGTACLYGTAALFILMNILSLFSLAAITNLAIFSNCLRLMFNGFPAVVLVSIAILRKVR